MKLCEATRSYTKPHDVLREASCSYMKLVTPMCCSSHLEARQVQARKLAVSPRRLTAQIATVLTPPRQGPTALKVLPCSRSQHDVQPKLQSF